MKNITLTQPIVFLIYVITMLTPATGRAADNIALMYSTYLGSSNPTSNIEITIDAQNNVYVAGKASSGPGTSNMPIVPGGYGDPNYYHAQSFVLKFSATRELVYSAFLQDAEITAITVDSSGRVYLAGNHQGTGNSPYCSDWGFFVARLSADGSNLDFCNNFAPHIGGETHLDITLDTAGDVYITGTYYSTGIPTTSGVIQQNHAGLDDAYVIKFSSDGSQILTAYYLGGSGNDIAQAIEVGANGTVYLSGYTESADFPSPNTLAGTRDAFLAKISNDGSTLLYSQLYGGSGSDSGLSLKVDSAGSAYIGGVTNSLDFPTTPGVFQPSIIDELSGMIIKVGADNSILFSTYLGAVTNIQAIDIDAAGSIYATGIVGSPNFVTTNNAFQEIYPLTLRNAYLTKLSADGNSLLYSSFLGSNFRNYGGGPDSALSGGFALSVKPNGEIVVGGWTNSGYFPVTMGAPRTTLLHAADLFVSIFKETQLSMADPLILGSVGIDNPFSYNLNVLGGQAPYEWVADPRYILGSLELMATGLLSGSWDNTYDAFLYEALRTYNYVAGLDILVLYPMPIGVKDATGDIAYKEYFVQINHRPVANAGSDSTVNAGRLVTLDASNSSDNKGDSKGRVASYSWNQLSGTAVTLNDASTVTASFKAPNANDTLVFELTVTDGYGLSSTDTVSITVNKLVYPISNGGGGSSRCFIATAAYGSPMEQEVEHLRDFRDTYLLTNTAGRLFVDAYYELSPPVARYIETSESLRAITRAGLSPLVWLARKLNTNSTEPLGNLEEGTKGSNSIETE